MTLKGKPMVVGVFVPLAFLCAVWALAQSGLFTPVAPAPAYADAADTPGIMEPYSLTIPACLTIDEQQTGSMNITGALQANSTLTVSSSSSGVLTSAEGATLAYQLDGANFTVQSHEDAVAISQTVTAIVIQTPVCSGTYTDCVTFTIAYQANMATAVDDLQGSEVSVPPSDASAGKTTEPSVSVTGPLDVLTVAAGSDASNVSMPNDANEKDGTPMPDIVPANGVTSSGSSGASCSGAASVVIGTPEVDEPGTGDSCIGDDISSSADSVGQTELNLGATVSRANGHPVAFGAEEAVPTIGVLKDSASDTRAASLNLRPVHSAWEDCPSATRVTECASISPLNNIRVSS